MFSIKIALAAVLGILIVLTLVLCVGPGWCLKLGWRPISHLAHLRVQQKNTDDNS